MKHKIKVVMLPTGDKSCICMTKNKIYFYPQNNWFSKDYETQPLHLYITVSQDVIGGKEVYYIDKFTNKLTSSGGAEYGSKQDVVIATTDTSYLYPHKYLETIPQSFLKEYVANPDGEWEVEYDLLLGDEEDENQNLIPKNYLKLNQDNTVNITSIEKKMYSKEEVERIIINSFEDGYQSRVQESYGQNVYDVDDFIKDNL